jgi:hypothetical protein
MPEPNPEPPLRRADLTLLQQSLARQQRRRRAYRPGPLRVYADGHEWWQGDPRAGACAPFRVPLTVAVLEVCGEDAEGALLLAVCPLPDPEVVADEGVQRLSVTLDGGQTVALTIALDDRNGGEAPAYVIQLAYHDETTARPTMAGHANRGPAVEPGRGETTGNDGRTGRGGWVHPRHFPPASRTPRPSVHREEGRSGLCSMICPHPYRRSADTPPYNRDDIRGQRGKANCWCVFRPS